VLVPDGVRTAPLVGGAGPRKSGSIGDPGSRPGGTRDSLRLTGPATSAAPGGTTAPALPAPEAERQTPERPGEASGGTAGGRKTIWQKVRNAFRKAFSALGRGFARMGKAIATAGKRAWEGIKRGARKIRDGIVAAARKVWSGLKWFWKKCGTYLLLAAQIVTFLVPGLQPLALGLAAVNVALAAKKIADASKTRDRKGILSGVFGLIGSVAGGIAAAATKGISRATEAVLGIVDKGSGLGGRVVDAISAAGERNWLGLTTAVVGGAGAATGVAARGLGSLGKVGRAGVKLPGLDKAEKGLDLAGKVADGTTATVAGIQSSDAEGIASGVVGLGLAAGGYGRDARRTKATARDVKDPPRIELGVRAAAETTAKMPQEANA